MDLLVQQVQPATQDRQGQQEILALPARQLLDQPALQGLLVQLVYLSQARLDGLGLAVRPERQATLVRLVLRVQLVSQDQQEILVLRVLPALLDLPVQLPQFLAPQVLRGLQLQGQQALHQMLQGLPALRVIRGPRVQPGKLALVFNIRELLQIIFYFPDTQILTRGR